MSNEAEEVRPEPGGVQAEDSADSRKSLWGDPVDERQERAQATLPPQDSIQEESAALEPPPAEDGEGQAEEEADEGVEVEGQRRLSLIGHKPLEPVADSRIPVMRQSPTAPPPTERPLDEAEDDEAGDPEDSDDEDAEEAQPLGAYDPAEFQDLPVSAEVKELFQYIDAYRPQSVEIEPVLKPFVLDYIPAVGDIDAFIKIPRPDGVDDNLGLIVLDEPCAQQSDPTVLDLKIRAVSKEATPKDTVVKRLERADKNTREIEQWITNIGELHKSKPATNVHYSKTMPDIDSLMQEWPSEFEEMLKKIELPTADMDISLEQYVDLICAVLDIPVHKSRVQSLHVLFTLYSEFKNSQHFKTLADANELDNEMKDGTQGTTDRLVL